MPRLKGLGLKLIYLEWLDSISNGGWRHETKPESLVMRSCGILVNETKQYITISTSRADVGCYESPLTIPKCAITKRRNVK